MLHIFADGSITGGAWGKKDQPDTTPHAWSGFVIKTKDGQYVHHHSIDWGENPAFSGNTAEYGAVFCALKWVVQHHPNEPVTVFSDSQLIINQLSGRFQCHNQQLAKLRDATRAVARRLPWVTYTWIPREKNREADVCSKIFQLFDHMATWQEVQEKLPKK